jgi:hypothetical protein
VLGRVWRIDAAYALADIEVADAEIARLAVARDRSEQARQLAVRIQDLSGAGISYSFALGLFAAGRTDEARAVYETLRQLPAGPDRDIRTFGALALLMNLIIVFRDTETAQATYDLFRPVRPAGPGASPVSSSRPSEPAIR